MTATGRLQISRKFLTRSFASWTEYSDAGDIAFTPVWLHSGAGCIEVLKRSQSGVRAALLRASFHLAPLQLQRTDKSAEHGHPTANKQRPASSLCASGKLRIGILATVPDVVLGRRDGNYKCYPVLRLALVHSTRLPRRSGIFNLNRYQDDQDNDYYR